MISSVGGACEVDEPLWNGVMYFFLESSNTVKKIVADLRHFPLGQ